MKQIVFKAIADAARSGERVVLALISSVKGSSPQKIGAKALFHEDGRIEGTLGGGCLEAEIQQRALQSLRTGKPAAFDLLLDHDFGWDDGLICGGKVCGLILPNAASAGTAFWSRLARRQTSIVWGIKKNFSIAQATDTNDADWLYRETISPRCHLWIAGAGHIAQAAAPLAAQLDFNVTVFDDRPALVDRRHFPRGISLQADVWEKLLAFSPPAQPAFALIVTRGHRHDALVLENWIHKPFLFIGMIGSSRKARIIFDHFREEKIATPEELRRVACPVGIPIRSQSVQEIAVSILAQFIEKRAELAHHQGVSPVARTELA